MSELSSEQVVALARPFFCVGKNLLAYREHHWDNLTIQQHEHLSKMQRIICNYTDDLIALSQIFTLNELDDTLLRVSHICRQVNDFIEQEHDTDKVIDVSGRVVMLGGAVVSQSPLAIVSTLAHLEMQLQQV